MFNFMYVTLYDVDIVELFANSGDPDQNLHSAASDLGLHFLPVTRLGVYSLQPVKTLLIWSRESY